MKYLIPFLLIFGLGYYLYSQAQPTTPQLTMRVLDVGQGDAIYIKLPTGEDILIDAGPDDRVISQLGRYMNWFDRDIELAIVSHNHADHIGGFPAVMGRYRIQQLWISGAVHTAQLYLDFLTTVRHQAIPTTTVKAGDQVTIGPTNWLVLWPPQDMTGASPEDQHDATIVVKVSWQDWCLLLTGDLDAGHEEKIHQIANNLQQSLECPVYKVTHHGSKYGSSEAFLAAIKPDLALISVGVKNRYGHPHQATLDRLTNSGAQIFRTDQQGTITVKTDGHSFWTSTAK